LDVFEKVRYQGVYGELIDFLRKIVTRQLTKPGDSLQVFKIVSDYLTTLYDDEELSSEETIRKFRIVQTEGN